MTASAVAIISDVIRDGKLVIGFAFDSFGRYSHGGILRERFIPRVLDAKPDDYQDQERSGPDPFKIWNLAMAGEKPGGHGDRSGAVGLLDAAVWDLVAKLEDKPLWHILSERFGEDIEQEKVPVYATTGHYHSKNDISRLGNDVKTCLDRGFTKIKIKAGGATLSEDERRIDTALGIIDGQGSLALDLNGMMSQEEAGLFIKQIGDRDLAWIEEPVGPLDFEATKAVAGSTNIPIATGENLFSAEDTRNLLLYGGLRPNRDILQMDISLSYGIVEYLRILDELKRHGWPRSQCAPHAGHLLAFNTVAGLGLGLHETTPYGPLSSVLNVRDGVAQLTTSPGVGFENHPSFRLIFDDLVSSHL